MFTISKLEKRRPYFVNAYQIFEQINSSTIDMIDNFLCTIIECISEASIISKNTLKTGLNTEGS